MAEPPTNHENPEALQASEPVKPGPAPGAAAAVSTEALSPSIWEELSTFGGWCARNPLSVALLLGILATFFYFFAVFHPFVNGVKTTARWAWEAWNPEGNQQHGRLVPFLTLGLIWMHRDELRLAVKRGSNLGLIPLGIGIFLFVLSVRCLQPRMALAGVPFLLYGAVLFVWGKAVARVLLFPCAFLIFMIPVAALEQATFRLQFIITGLVGLVAHFFGIGIQAIGTTLTASDGSFNFEIAEGCSGIRSLAAMTMLTAIYVHLTQDRIWKMGVIFFCSVFFAIVGNVGRIFTVVLVAKYYDPKFAGGLYHDYSGYLFFPIAFMAMLLFSKLVNLNVGSVQKLAVKMEAKAKAAEKEPASYDY